MAWTHDEESNTIRCVSVKHGRDLTIQLPQSGDNPVYCRECWRYCMFGTLAHVGTLRRMVHTFTPSKPDENGR